MGQFKVRFRQRPIKGGRLHVGAGVEEAIRKTVEREARRYGASMSFVISVALADYFGISLKHDEDYRERPKSVEPTKPADEKQETAAVAH